MANNSKIEWTQATWNPVSGCTRASPGCDNCYAVKQTYRLEKMGQVKKYGGLTVINPKGDRHFNGVVRCDEDALMIPLRRRKPTVYFVNSMSDLFHKDVPFDYIDRVFAVMAICPQHTFQVLTKRPDRMAEYLESRRRSITFFDDAARTFGYSLRFDMGNGHPLGLVKFPLKNVWLGTSVENQATADERIPHLLQCPAAVRFISYEPALGAVDFLRVRVGEALAPHNPEHRIDALRLGYWDKMWGYVSHSDLQNGCGGHGIDWVIVGGESGPNARPCNVERIRWIIAQCKAAGVPVFVKQLGAVAFDAPRDRLWTTTSHHRSGRIDSVMSDDGGEAETIPTIELKDRKGGDPSEWPADLRVREMPKVMP